MPNQIICWFNMIWSLTQDEKVIFVRLPSHQFWGRPDESISNLNGAAFWLSTTRLHIRLALLFCHIATAYTGIIRHGFRFRWLLNMMWFWLVPPRWTMEVNGDIFPEWFFTGMVQIQILLCFLGQLLFSKALVLRVVFMVIGCDCDIDVHGDTQWGCWWTDGCRCRFILMHSISLI